MSYTEAKTLPLAGGAARFFTRPPYFMKTRRNLVGQLIASNSTSILRLFDGKVYKFIDPRVRGQSKADAVALLRAVDLVLGGKKIPGVATPLGAAPFRIDGVSKFALVYEYIEGKNLDALLREQTKISLDQALEIILSSINSLERLKKLGIFHGDLKPSNIMIDKIGRIILIDSDVGVGFAQGIYTTGMRSGTNGYIAPEKYRGEKPSEISDLFSLGIILAQILNEGLHPLEILGFDDTDSAIAIQKSINQCGLKPFPQIVLSEHEIRVQDESNRIICKATAFAKADRYQTMEHFAKDLEALKALLSPKVL